MIKPSDKLSRREARQLYRRIAIAKTVSIHVAVAVLRDLPPEDIAALETFSRIAKERARINVNAV